MNLKTMQESSTDLYDWTRKQYPDAEIIIMGHSYGAGMAAYLASVRPCRTLILAACFKNSELKIFDDITHENYFVSEDVVRYVNEVIR